MKDFISDDEMAEIERNQPAGFLSDDQVAEIESKKLPSQLESGTRGAAQGLSFGFADEITGALESAAGSLGIVPDKTYEQARNESRAAYHAAEEANPGTYMAGQVGGSLATLAIPGVGALGAGAGAGLKGLAIAAGLGAAQGGLYGLGASEAQDLSQMAKDTALGAGVGGVLGGVGYGLSKGIEKAVPALAKGSKTAAEDLSARALGAERGTIKSLGADKVRAAGRYALDEGIVSPLASTDDLIARNNAALTRSGSGGQAVREAIDEKGLSNFNPLKVAEQFDEKSGNFWRTPINKGATNQFENTLETILQRGDDNIPLSEAQKLKGLLGEAANWKNKLNISEKEQIARDAYGVVAKAIDDAVDQGAKSLDNPNLLQSLKEANKTYSSGKTAEKLLENKYAREQGNRLFGLTDAITSGAGFAGGGPLTAGAIFAGKKGLEKYGLGTAAVGLDKLGNLLQKMPEKFGRYGGVLRKATERGGSALGATHYILQSSDPEYRKMLKEMQGD